MKSALRRARGFTLIELMIVVAIIGILSSVALPVFKNFSLRARQSERRVVMKTIKQSAEDFFVRFGRIEDNVGNPMLVLTGPPNPLGPESATKRAFNTVPDACPNCGWSLLGVTEQYLDGSLYYTYQWTIVDVVGVNQTLYIQADGDLDGDGLISTRRTLFQLQTQAYTPIWEWPPVVNGTAVDDMDENGVYTW
jgi:prepilin-type N-terminal cleavage/methylation domain-containing protein